jgi:hypothetical protein
MTITDNTLYYNPTKMTVHYSSSTCMWEAPQEFFDRLNKVYRFTCDVCATPSITKVPSKYYTEEQDGLMQN